MYLMRSFHRSIGSGTSPSGGRASISCRSWKLHKARYKASQVCHSHRAFHRKYFRYYQVTPVTNTGESASGLQHGQTKFVFFKFPCGIRVESEVGKSWPFKTMRKIRLLNFSFGLSTSPEQHEVLTHSVLYKTEQKGNITSLTVPSQNVRCRTAILPCKSL